MALPTTCIGAYPKPDFLKLPDWFKIANGPDDPHPTGYWEKAVESIGGDLDGLLQRACYEVIRDQIESGIDIPTDGELPRENYIHYHCRHLDGFDFNITAEKEMRGGTYSAWLPRIVAPLTAREIFLPGDWRRARRCTDKPVKITMPGPMTMADSVVDSYYHDPVRLGADIADLLNAEVRALADAGCRHIQIDEPLFARKPDAALDYGVENIERAFHKCPDDVVRTMHMCCGYPDRLDRPDYPKAPVESYHQLAKEVDASSVMAVSIEDAHRHNDLSLLDSFQHTAIILGVVAIAKSEIESVDEIRARLEAALDHIDADRLLAAPDCGLGLLGRELAKQKLRNLSQAAHSL